MTTSAQLLRELHDLLAPGPGAPRPTASAAARRLCDGGLWLDACTAAAEADDPLLKGVQDNATGAMDPAGGTLARTTLNLLERKGPTTRCHLVARAVWHAARAARHLRHGPQDTRLREAAPDTAWTAVWLDAARRTADGAEAATPEPPALPAPGGADRLREGRPGLPWALADALVRRCLTGRGEPSDPVTAKVLDDRPEASDPVATMTLYLVDDEGEHVLPDCESMLCTAHSADFDAELTATFAWARAQQDFPRGQGLRWRITTADGNPLPTTAAVTPAAAVTVALARLLSLRRGRLAVLRSRPGFADPRVVVHATITPQGHPRPASVRPGTVERALAAGNVLLFAEGDCAATGTAGRSVRRAGTLRQALRRSRRLPRRFVAVVCAALLALSGLLAWTGIGARDRAERDRIAVRADELAAEALDRGSPADRALVDALAAHALAPHTAATRNALLSAVNVEQNLTKIVPTGARGLHAVGVSHDGGYAAAIDARDRLRVWNVRTAAETDVPAGLDGAAQLAFPRGKGALAVATDHGVASWDPADPGRSPVWHTRAPATVVAYSRDGRYLALGGVDGTVEVRETREAGKGHRIRLPEADRSPTALAFDLSGDTLAVGARGVVRMWSWRSEPRPGHAADDLGAPVHAVTYADPCKCFYAASGASLRALTPKAAAVRKPVTIPLSAQVAYSRRDEALYVASSNALAVFSAVPEELTDDEGQRDPRRFLGQRINGRAAFALSGDGRRLVMPTSSGALFLYDLSDHEEKYGYLPLTSRIDAIAGSDSLLYVSKWMGNAAAAVFDPRAGKGIRERVGVPLGQQSTAYSAEHAVLAVADADGSVRLRRITAHPPSIGPALPPLVKPKGQKAISVAFDDSTDRLYAAWQWRVTVFDMSRPTRPRRLEDITLPDTERVLAIAPTPDRRTLFIGTTRGLHALPMRAGRYSWKHRTTLASGAFIRVQADTGGTVVGGTYTGAITLFRPAGPSWSPLPLRGRGATTGAVGVYGDRVVVADRMRVAVYETTSGTQLVDMDLPGMLPTGLYFDGATVRVYGDLGDTTAFPLETKTVLTRACALLRDGGRTQVADAWPGAPPGVRSRALCPRP
ncbi:WD40 repeat domain-containing protein [Streptomyces massasporeus]